jgi:hypothetical protein
VAGGVLAQLSELSLNTLPLGDDAITRVLGAVDSATIEKITLVDSSPPTVVLTRSPGSSPGCATSTSAVALVVRRTTAAGTCSRSGTRARKPLRGLPSVPDAAAWRTLRTLTLKDCALGDADIALLPVSAPMLESLSLSYNNIGSDGLARSPRGRCCRSCGS